MLMRKKLNPYIINVLFFNLISQQKISKLQKEKDLSQINFIYDKLLLLFYLRIFCLGCFPLQYQQFFKQMQPVPSTKNTLKTQINQMITILRNYSSTQNLQTFINRFQIFTQKVMNNHNSYDLLKSDFQTLKQKFNQKIKEVKNLSKENSKLKKNLQNKEQQISRITFSKRLKANKDLIKEERPNTMFDYDLMFQRGKQHRAVQSEDIFATYDQKIRKLTLENEQIKGKFERSQTQYQQKLTENEVLKELLYKYLQDIKIGGNDNYEDDEEIMIPQNEEKTETMSEVQQIQSYCSQSMMEESQDLGDPTLLIPMKNTKEEETNVDIDAEIQQESKKLGIIWQTYKTVLRYLRISQD